MKKLIYISFLLTSIIQFNALHAQNEEGHLEGRILELQSDGSQAPLVGANIYWVGGTDLTATDASGEFHIDKIESTNKLVISHVAFTNDTIDIVQDGFIILVMESEVELGTVEVVSRRRSTSISYLTPIKTETIGKKELAKAACCNLSESFETSPTVDVSFTDAVTGTRQIQLLGLAGPYTQITRENIPDIRGLSALYGLSHSPGTWVESIQLNKGTGSVVNGYESIAGQINVELEKPEESDKLFINLFGNIQGRAEANVHFTQKLSEKVHTGLLGHYSQNSIRNDNNEDGFFDNPLKQDIILLNRWRYVGEKGIRAQAGIKYVNSTHFGGQIDYDGLKKDNEASVWGLDLNNQRIEAWTKTGWVNEAKPWQSFGLQMAGMVHSQESNFGSNSYDADQKMFYANFIYQGILGNTNHKFKTGLSYQFDQFDEFVNAENYTRNESVPGIYGEYTYSQDEKLGIVLGLRADYHNQFGAFVTPRVHIRYALKELSILRLSAGQGRRTANVFAENFALFASNRDWKIKSENAANPYGLDQEIAWNFGLSFQQGIILNDKEGQIAVDFFRTDFQNQVVIDVDQSPQEVNIYNLEGDSYSNSMQVQLDYELIKRFDVRVAYRIFDVKTKYEPGLLEKPLVARHRGFVNLAYATKDDWSFDYTLNIQGRKRIPSTVTNPIEFQTAEYSPSFPLMNAQVSKSWKEKFDVYVGVENIMNYRQEDAILDATNPFGDYFDSSLVWGPVFGRNIYAGLRYRLF